MARLLDVDPRLRKLCLIDEGEKGYSRSVKLLKRDGAREVKAVLDDPSLRLGHPPPKRRPKKTLGCGSEG